MKQEIAMIWADYLENLNLPQGRLQLCNADGFCCLGVLEMIHMELDPEYNTVISESSATNGIITINNSRTYLTAATMIWAGIANQSPWCIADDGTGARYLTDLNDIQRYTFPQIAAVIRKYWKEL